MLSENCATIWPRKNRFPYNLRLITKSFIQSLVSDFKRILAIIYSCPNAWKLHLKSSIRLRSIRFKAWNSNCFSSPFPLKGLQQYWLRKENQHYYFVQIDCKITAHNIKHFANSYGGLIFNLNKALFWQLPNHLIEQFGAAETLFSISCNKTEYHSNK